MIQYGAEASTDLKFEALQAAIDPRDLQWVDVELKFRLAPGSSVPPDLTELTALLVCTHTGDIFQIVPQDEGRDCEYQFTETEKAQLRQFYEEHVKQRLLRIVQAGAEA